MHPVSCSKGVPQASSVYPCQGMRLSAPSPGPIDAGRFELGVVADLFEHPATTSASAKTAAQTLAMPFKSPPARLLQAPLPTRSPSPALERRAPVAAPSHAGQRNT